METKRFYILIVSLVLCSSLITGAIIYRARVVRTFDSNLGVIFHECTNELMNKIDQITTQLQFIRESIDLAANSD